MTQRTHRCRGSGLEDQEGGLGSLEEERIDQPRQDPNFPVLTCFVFFGLKIDTEGLRCYVHGQLCQEIVML